MIDLLPNICKIENELIYNVIDIIMKKYDDVKKVLIISDEHLYQKYGKIILNQINKEKIKNKLILIEEKCSKYRRNSFGNGF